MTILSWTIAPRTITPPPLLIVPGTISLDNYPPCQLPTQTIPLWTIAPYANCPPDNYPPDNYPVDNCSADDFFLDKYTCLPPIELSDTLKLSSKQTKLQTVAADACYYNCCCCIEEAHGETVRFFSPRFHIMPKWAHVP